MRAIITRLRGLATLFVVAALALTGCAGVVGGGEPLTDATKKLLTVVNPTASCTKIVAKLKGKDAVVNGVYALRVEATTPASKRYVTTSPGLPLKGKTEAARHADIRLTLCTDPLQGGEFAHYLAHAKVGDTRILDLNEWLRLFDIKVEEVAIFVQKTYLPNFGKKAPTDEEFAAQAAATRAYAEFASKLVTLLDRFQRYDETSAKSQLNYTLAGGGAVVDKVPALQLNSEQERLKAKRYALTEKDQCKPLLVMGFNFHDKRVEQFAPPNECKKKTTTSTNVGNGGGGGHKPPGKVLVCVSNGKTTKWVPKSEAHKYRKPDRKGLCPKTGSSPGLTTHGEKNKVNRNNGATDSRGLQNNPGADAAAAKAKAEAEAAAKKKAAEEAAAKAAADSGGGDDDHKPADPPDEGW